MSFEFLDHTADVAVRLQSRDERELFRDATRALLAVLLDEREGPVAPVLAVGIRLEAESPEALLIDYLNELIFRFDSQRFLAADLEPAVLVLGSPASRLEAVLRGEAYDPARHRAKTEVKAATFHDLEIRRTAAGFEAEVVFDL